MSHETGDEHEMADSTSDDFTTVLLNNKQPGAPRAFSAQRNARFHDFLRHTRLQVLRTVFRPWNNRVFEPYKVAIHRSRRIAALHCLLHMIPSFGAVTLLVLRLMHYWVGFETPDPTVLQFVAKLHELLMQLSLVEVILYTIRVEATERFVPLGALSAAMKATQLSYLWSFDFWSIFKSDAFQGRAWRKVVIVVALFALFVLTALVGPSSAVLMIPGPGCPKSPEYAKRFMTTNSSQIVFPGNMGTVEGLEMDAATMKPIIWRYEFRSEEVISSETNLSDLDSSINDRLLHVTERELKLSPLDGDTSWGYVGGATAIIPTRVTTDLLRREGGSGEDETGRNNATRSITMLQPTTQAECITLETNQNSNVNDDAIYYLQRDSINLGFLGNMSSLAHQVRSRGILRQCEYDNLVYTNCQFFEPIWLASPEPGSASSVVILIKWLTNSTELQSLDWVIGQKPWILSIPDENYHNAFELRRLQIEVCSVSAYWNTAISTLPFESGRAATTEILPSSLDEQQYVKNITLNVTGIDMLTAPSFNADFNADSYGNFAISLAIVLTIAIANTVAYNWSEWVFSLYERNSVSELSGPNVTFDRQSVWYSYGYCSNSTSVRLSLTVILLYCIITVAYLTYIVVSGITSTAWNSAVEFFALALQSKKPDYPGQISVGIDSPESFKQGVSIRVNKHDELELVFASDRDIETRGLRKIEKNMVY